MPIHPSMKPLSPLTGPSSPRVSVSSALATAANGAVPSTEGAFDLTDGARDREPAVILCRHPMKSYPPEAAVGLTDRTRKHDHGAQLVAATILHRSAPPDIGESVGFQPD